MSQELSFPKAQPVLRKAPLKAVICQLRFPRILGFNEQFVRPIQQELASDYPHTEVARLASFSLGPSGPATDADNELIYRFKDEDRRRTVTVTPTSLSLETNAYSDFETFARQWYGLAAIVVEMFRLTQQERIGLRYLNEFECPLALVEGVEIDKLAVKPDDLKALLRPELVGAVGEHERTQHLMASMQEMRFAQQQGYCTIRHGLVCQPDWKAAYVLDLDAYDDTFQKIDLPAQISLLAEFNHGMYDLFKWALAPDLFASFEPEPQAPADDA